MRERDQPFRFGDGLTVGVGSLPHRDALAASAFAMAEFDLATIPSLPQATPAEAMVGQALERFDGQGFTGFRSFLDLAVTVRHDGQPVKWQFIGPVTLGIELMRTGLPSSRAFGEATAIVRSRLAELDRAVTDILPNSPQLVILDEPSFGEVMSPDFAIPADEAVDLLSSAMAALPSSTVVGVHCCGPCDLAMLLASGPSVVSIPVAPEVVEWSGYISRFLDDGGAIAWGVVPTEGPLAMSADRHWRALSDLWCALVQRGCDPVLLRQHSLVSPQCGLASHSAGVARRIARLTSEVGRRVKDQSAATRLSLGA